MGPWVGGNSNNSCSKFEEVGCDAGWASFILNTEKLYPNVSHQIAARLYIGIWRCILIVLCVCIKQYTSTYIAKNRYGSSRRREYLVGVNSFSQVWSVLSPSRLVSFRSLFSRFTLSKYERLGEQSIHPQQKAPHSRGGFKWERKRS